ncbi:MAG: ABC transporter ATP-binding protein [Deltaproteobacteria bacterium]|nr:MAG: ABC transporter ATP-binding protein [Deltaproteobacteria bacterium]
MSGVPLAELERVTKVYGTGPAAVAALRGVDLRIEPCDLVAIMGPSGSGKSTAMHILGCLDVPTSGSHRMLGTDVSRLTRDQRALVRRRYLGFVFQSFHLLPGTTALENVELPLLYRIADVGERRARAERALAAVGLARRAGHNPAELSGGEQQRVAIARAIVGEPVLLLADEPTGNLDSRSRSVILDLLLELRRDRGLAIVIVTHDAAVAAWAARTVHFEDGRLQRDAEFGRPS